MQRVYLDYNATAPLLPEARAAMLEVMAQVGNPSSVHMEGRHARAIVEKARSDVADLVAADLRQVTFTSGGSEANASVLTPNWSRDGRPQRFDHLVVSAVEHPSVLAGGRFRPEAVKVAAVDGDGVVDLSRLDQLLGNMDGRAVVSVMHANNETGVIQPITDVARLAHRHEALVHSDAVQAVGRIPVDLAASGVDVMTLSAHKLGGPPGCGAVIRAPDAPTFEPLVGGGGQESRLRAGTENVVAIAGFGATARASRFDEARSSNWRALVARLKQEIGPAVHGLWRWLAHAVATDPVFRRRGRLGRDPGHRPRPGRRGGVVGRRLLVRKGRPEPRAGRHGRPRQDLRNQLFVSVWAGIPMNRA